MFLFAIVAIFLLYLIYLLYLLFKRNKQINYQKKEIELITNSVSVGLCKIDHNFELVWENETIEKTYNVSEELLQSNRSCGSILQSSYFELVKEKLKGIRNEEVVVLEGAMTKNFEPKPIFEEGMIWLKTVCTPLRSKKGTIEYFIVLIDDHTNEKTVEYHLEKQKNKIEAMNGELKEKSQIIVKQNFELEQINNQLKVSNENLSQFAAIAAHDLKAPLRTITSFSKILLRKYKEKINASDAELFNFIINDAQSLKEMIDGLLEYSRISNENLKLTAVSLENIIFMSVSKLKASIREKSAEIIVPDNFPMVKGHATLVEQVILNLVNNSLKFMPENVCPVIKIACKEYDENYVLISVEDNGIGIDKKYHDTIFNIFRKLHSKGEYKGNGIGLSTCKKIVESCGGTMWLESELGKGTTFFFTLQKENLNTYQKNEKYKAYRIFK